MKKTIYIVAHFLSFCSLECHRMKRLPQPFPILADTRLWCAQSADRAVEFSPLGEKGGHISIRKNGASRFPATFSLKKKKKASVL